MIQDISRFDALIEKFVHIKERYGDDYPIVLYEPSINCQEKKALKNLIQGNISIHLFNEFKEALKFVQSLGISFILIASQDFDEKTVLLNFQAFESICGRAMFDFEEEAFLKDLFKGASDDKMKSLKLKVYSFFTLLDFKTETPAKEDEEEVMVMCDINDMAKEFRQDFIVIWYDPNITTESKKKLEEKIEIKMEENNIFLDFAELEKRIKNNMGVSYFLIFSGADKAENIIKEIDNLEDLLGLYIYDEKMENSSNGKMEIQKTLEGLIPKIKEGFRTKSKSNNTLPSFATNFDAMDKSHLYNVHYYLKGLINFHNRRQAKEDFIKLARKIYEDQEGLLRKFGTECDKYNAEKILYWYTRDSPVYKLLNNCLRIASSDSILYSRFALKDLEEAIRERYKQHSKDFNGYVYRAAYISAEEWGKLERNLGEEIEMYGFLSTTVNQRTAMHFFESDPQNKILITIIVPPLQELDEQGFADVSQLSDLKGEGEILFNVRTRFRILEANKGTKGRHLVLLYGARSLRKYMTKHQPVITVELKLPLERKCDQCGSNQKLFGFNQGVVTEVLCIKCLAEKYVPKGVPLLALDLESNNEGKEVIVKSFRGKVLSFNKIAKFRFYGYKCKSCLKTGRAKYYKWIDLNTKDGFAQCSDCFENKRKVECHVLIAETYPYMIWQEQQAEWETVDSDYQTELSQAAKEKTPGDVYLEVQEYNLCIAYEKKVLNQFKRMRWREMRKFKSLFTLGEASEKCGKHQEALGYLTKILEISETFSEKEHSEETPTLYNNLALVYQSLGQPQEALRYSTKAFDLTKSTHGSESFHTATSYNNLALMYENLGQYQKALELSKKGLEITETIYGNKHPQTAISYNNLGSVYVGVGEYQKALDFFIKALDLVRAIYGDKHPQTATCYNNIARVYKSQGQHQKALDYCAKALDLKKTLYGEKNRQTAVGYNNLGLMYESSGEYKKALEALTKGLKIIRDLFGEKHPLAATFYNSLAGVYKSQGRHQQALESTAKALDIRKSLYGDQHSDTATSYCNLAFMYNTLGRHQEALELLTKSLNIRKILYGDKHPDIAHSYSNLAFIYASLGQPQKALESYNKALEITKSVFGEDSPQTAGLYNNIAGVFQSLGRHQEALESSVKALDMTKKFHGDRHPDTATSYNNIAEMYRGLKRYSEALEYSKKALDISKSIYGYYHSQTYEIYQNLALIYEGLKKYQDALDCYQKTLDIAKRVFGEIHQNTATAYNNIAFTLNCLGRDEEAVEFHKEALHITKILYGDRHPKTADSYQKLALLYYNLGNFQNMQECQNKAEDILRNPSVENGKKNS